VVDLHAMQCETFASINFVTRIIIIQENIKKCVILREGVYTKYSSVIIRISLRHNLGRKCRKMVNFVSITHSERNIWNGPIAATAISREERKPVLEGNGCLTDKA
jgi:hypothetical protein